MMSFLCLHVLQRLCKCQINMFSCECHRRQSNIRISSNKFFDSNYIAKQRSLWVLFPILAQVLHDLAFRREDCTTVCRVHVLPYRIDTSTWSRYYMKLFSERTMYVHGVVELPIEPTREVPVAVYRLFFFFTIHLLLRLSLRQSVSDCFL